MRGDNASANDADSPKPGPEPETLNIEDDWKKAVKKAMKTKKPADGWPKRTDGDPANGT